MREREASQEQTTRFFADASHELRTPLASLRANAELYLQGALTSQDQVDEVMERIAIETRRMGRLVDDMLRLARLGQHPVQARATVGMTALVTGCADRVRAADQERTWRVSVAAGLRAVGDEELLRRAVDNLLINVLTHTPSDTETTVTATGDGRVITVEVTDNGPGVAADQLPHSSSASTGQSARPSARAQASAWPSPPRSRPPTAAGRRPSRSPRMVSG